MLEAEAAELKSMVEGKTLCSIIQAACASENGVNIKMLKAALAAGPDPNERDPKYGLTPLVMATLLGDINAVQILLDAGAKAFANAVVMMIRLDPDTLDFEEDGMEPIIGKDGKVELKHASSVRYFATS